MDNSKVGTDKTKEQTGRFQNSVVSLNYSSKTEYYCLISSNLKVQIETKPYGTLLIRRLEADSDKGVVNKAITALGKSFTGNDNATRSEQIISYLGLQGILYWHLQSSIVASNFENTLSARLFYETDSFESVFAIYLLDFLEFNLYLKRCANCGGLFIDDHYHAVYCDRIIDSKGRSCKQEGAMKQHKLNVSSDLIQNEYLKAYARIYARYKKGKTTIGELRTWSCKTKELIQHYKNGYLSEDSLLSWIKES